MEKLDLRKLNEQEALGIRKSALKMVQSGLKQKKVCELLGLRPNTVNDWCKKYKEKGSKGLCSKKRGAKSEDRKLLTAEQEHQVQKKIIPKFRKRYSQ
ncbi:MAG: helix-turn-helix domain-containing protein [Chitinophagales bacterium]|nr:helix-turn-helix domain-containing protein [Chitinophagales bacterium]